MAQPGSRPPGPGDDRRPTPVRSGRGPRGRAANRNAHLSLVHDSAAPRPEPLAALLAENTEQLTATARTHRWLHCARRGREASAWTGGCRCSSGTGPRPWRVPATPPSLTPSHEVVPTRQLRVVAAPAVDAFTDSGPPWSVPLSRRPRGRSPSFRPGRGDGPRRPAHRPARAATQRLALALGRSSFGFGFSVQPWRSRSAQIGRGRAQVDAPVVVNLDVVRQDHGGQTHDQGPGQPDPHSPQQRVQRETPPE